MAGPTDKERHDPHGRGSRRARAFRRMKVAGRAAEIPETAVEAAELSLAAAFALADFLDEIRRAAGLR